MKKGWKIITILMLLLIAFTITGCASDKGGDRYGDFYGPKGGDGEQSGIQIEAGQLTAAVLDDASNYLDWLSFQLQDEQQKDGVFKSSYQIYSQLGINPARHLIKVNVANIDGALPFVTVSLHTEQGSAIEVVTDCFGNCYIFCEIVDNQSTYIIVSYSGLEERFDFAFEKDENKGYYDIAITLDAQKVSTNTIDLMFVIDTTGSMGDELEYLKVEIKDVINELNTSLTAVTIRLALVFYRDIGDDYVTRKFDFTTDINSQVKNISKQTASGGGDYEEAVDQALEEAMDMDWSVEPSTKIIYHVLDAPIHQRAQNANRYTSALITAASKGIRIIPVASSGIDINAEYLLRTEALLTGGRYIFLTDDSGIGGDHLEPTTNEEYVVEYLNELLVRLVIEYHTGVKTEPVPIVQINQ